MKKIIGALVALYSAFAFSATTVPVQLLNPTGSTSGQAVVSTGASSAPAWGTVATSGANSNITSLSGLTTPLSVPQGGTGLATITQFNILAGNGAGTISAIGPSTSGFVLTSNGGGAFPSFQAIPTQAGRLLGVQVITSTQTYTPTAGTNSVVVDVQAPGGGGGATPATAAGQDAIAGGGSGGSYAKARVTSGFSGVTVTIGATGTGGAAGANAGVAGGTTSFGAIVSCPGGNGGAAGTALTPPFAVNGATSPAACTVSGATTLTATQGGQGTSAYALSTSSLAGSLGGISASGTGTANGSGSGGSGAAAAPSSAAAAGAGASAGRVVVFEYQ